MYREDIRSANVLLLPELTQLQITDAGSLLHSPDPADRSPLHADTSTAQMVTRKRGVPFFFSLFSLFSLCKRMPLLPCQGGSHKPRYLDTQPAHGGHKHALPST